MRKTIAVIIISVLALIAIPVAFIAIGFGTPSQYAATYYGELCKMYDHLRSAEGKKIVIIGTSSVAFGIDSALMESELKAAGADYEVINFGLYGALGTKIMLDLSEAYIGAGDLVIFAPELNEQSMSLYFSAKDMWYAADSDISLLGGIADENAAEMTGNFIGYAASKLGCILSGSPAAPSGVYASASFDENCDMKNAERPHNIMSGGTDPNNPIHFDESVISPDFIDYVNDYCAAVSEKGATMLYSFSPMNEGAFDGDTDTEAAEYYEFVSTHFDFDIISDPTDSIMRREWFYDSNFHLNSSGMIVRTVQLTNDIKNYLGITVPTSVELPEMPKMPESGKPDAGINEHADLFTYENDGDGLRITGIADGAQLPERVIVPYSYDGKVVLSFDANVFAGNKNIVEVIVQDNITVLRNGSFNGCTTLERLVLTQTDPSAIGVGQGLLTGADRCRIYVAEESYAVYVSNYFWGNYAGRFEIDN